MAEPHGGGGEHVGDPRVSGGLVAAVLAQPRRPGLAQDPGQPRAPGDVLHLRPDHGPGLLVHPVPVPVRVDGPQLLRYSGLTCGIIHCSLINGPLSYSSSLSTE